MSRSTLPAFLLLAFHVAFAQAQSPAPQAPPAGATVLTMSTQLVQVDVVVTDTSGAVVHGLTAADFHVQEDKKPQTVRNFEETLSVPPSKIAAAPQVKLTPGTFTDYSPVPDKTPLTVLLLDRLNTPAGDQQNMKLQLVAFLRSAPPNTRMAIFGLSSRLVMLQGFTSDPNLLRATIDQKGMQQSHMLGSPGAELNLDNAPNAAALQQFEDEASSFQDQNRVLTTLTAFEQLAAYLGSFPGRKNVIWFSNSFPITVGEETYTDEFHKMTNLLARSRVAIYPVEASGLQTDPTFSPSYVSPVARASGAAALAAQLQGTQSWQNSLNIAHATMQQLAHDTGGRAYYNSNDLIGAVNDSLANGAQYYTLTYTPTNKDTRDGFRAIRVELTGAAAARGYKLAYRTGYFTVHNKPAKGLDEKAAEPAATVDPAVAAALQHGAPAPSEILFKARVLPAAPGAKAPPGPGQAYTVDFSALTSHVELTPGDDGKNHGAVEFAVLTFDSEGKQLGMPTVRPVKLDVPAAGVTQFLHNGLGVSLTVLAPPHASTFRLAVHDLTSGHIGVVEIPLSAVRNLPPAAPGS